MSLGYAFQDCNLTVIPRRLHANCNITSLTVNHDLYSYC
jgi:hypothetical protein